MLLNRRGQVSFEILLITAIIFMLAIWISSYYLSIKDSMLAMQLAKIHALKKIEESDSLYTIDRIDFEETAQNAITLKIDIAPNFSDAFGCDELRETVADNTKYKPMANVTINLDESDC